MAAIDLLDSANQKYDNTTSGLTATNAQDAIDELAASGGAETDPVVGAVNGIVKADGAGNISAAVAGVDYLTSETSHADVLVDGDFNSAGYMKTDGAGVYSVEANLDADTLDGQHGSYYLDQNNHTNTPSRWQNTFMMMGA